MDLIYKLGDILSHLDERLAYLTNHFGAWTYLILFAIIFAETGLVIAPFLPGDGLLFAIGIFVQNEHSGLNIGTILVSLSVAAIIGNTVNYHISSFIGKKLLERKNSQALQKHLDRTHDLFNKYGGWALVLARFMPFARTFAPFVAGISRMNYFMFQVYNVVGALVWVLSVTLLGYYVGKSANAHKMAATILLIVVVVSVLPIIYKYIELKIKGRKKINQATSSANVE